MSARASSKAKTAAKARAKPATRRAGGKQAAGKGRIGSSFDDFLREDGSYEETQAIAIKRVIAWAIAEEMKKQGVSKADMARRMNTSRSQLDRLLDPDNADVKLDTLARAARALDRELRLELAAA